MEETELVGTRDVLLDSSLFKSTLNSIAESSSSVHSLLQPSSMPGSLPSYSNGVSLLSLKNSILLTYIHDLTLLSLCKLQGRSLESDSLDVQAGVPSNSIRKVLVEDLVRNRVILEKIKPMEVKLRYQIDKLVKKANDVEQSQREGRGAARDAVDEVNGIGK